MLELINHWGIGIKEQIHQISIWEGIGVSFGVAEVLFAKKNKVWLYPCGITSIIITAYLFFHAGLYAEMFLQTYYFFMSIYGWVLWSEKKGQRLTVEYSSSLEWEKAFAIVISAWAILYILLLFFTNSDVPFFDSLVSAFAWSGMWLLAKRKIENWIFLNVSNLIAIPLLIHKGLILYSALTLFLFIIAVFGYVEWKKLIEKRTAD
ncbi:nicotinamide riboside transporter PnuC [Apibacter raozihei]|uniref:nicotinamide riboside transporter PnuC n=1 Tax=Apibacter raozihei TaxID=2500547 RepID=UPI000FE2CAFB|nr:nicotinamide riboside transporter PnuC [Apibacter raozihei]